MSLKKTLGLTLVILSFFTNCSSNDDSSNNELIIYQEGNVKITLIDVSDSRCPTNMDCVWPGNGEVEMRIVKENETADFTLNTAGYINDNLDFPKNISILDVNIELLDLQPYPENGISYALEDYTISLDVTN